MILGVVWVTSVDKSVVKMRFAMRSGIEMTVELKREYEETKKEGWEKGTWEEGRQRVPMWRFGRESWNPGWGSTTPWSSTMPHSSQLPSPQLHLTRISIFSPFLSTQTHLRIGNFRRMWCVMCDVVTRETRFIFPPKLTQGKL